MIRSIKVRFAAVLIKFFEGFKSVLRSNPNLDVCLCRTTRRRFPIIGRFQTRLGIFQPSNQNVRNGSGSPFRSGDAYFSFSWFLLLCLYRDNIFTK